MNIIKSIALLLIVLLNPAFVRAQENLPEPKPVKEPLVTTEEGGPLKGRYLEKVVVVKTKPSFNLSEIKAFGNSALELASELPDIPAGKGVEQRYCEVLGQPGYLTLVHYQGRKYTSALYRMPDNSYNLILGVENPSIENDDLVMFDTGADDNIDSLASIAVAEGKTSEIKIGTGVEKPLWFKSQFEAAKFALQEFVTIRRKAEPGVSYSRTNYDALSRVIRELARNSTGQTMRTTYTYSPAGNRASRRAELLDSDGNVIPSKPAPQGLPAK